MGPITARNLDGRGIRVTVIGQKGKGDTARPGLNMRSGGIRGGHQNLFVPGGLL